MSKVVNIRLDKYDVYIGRAGKGQTGEHGNPVAVGKVCQFCQQCHRRGGETLPCYRKYLTKRLKEDPEYKTKVYNLKGLVLGCFCAPKGGLTISDPERCHGQVLLKAINWLHRQKNDQIL